MDAPALVDVTEDSLPQFFDVNAIAHETIFTSLLSTGVVVDHYPLWTDGFTADWLELHYREHVAWSNVLSIEGAPDLSVAPDEAEQQTWFTNHALHHQIVARALNL